MATQITITRTISTLPSGHILAEYTACKGAHKGQQRIGLVSPSGKPVRSAPVVASPAPASKPARKKSAPKRVKKAASKASKASKPLTFNVMSEVYTSVLDSRDALTESAPVVPADADATRDLDARVAARKTRKLDERSLHSEAASLSDRMARIEAAILALASK